LAIPREGIFKLDVDDEIWQDVGLNEESDGLHHCGLAMRMYGWA